jgi:DNA-binding response OmpR family regulator
MRILLVEDERKLSSFIARGLESEGNSVECAYDGESGASIFIAGSHDVVILDLMLPKRSGIEVLKEARAKGMITPVIILTARDSIESKLDGFQAGTDDYLTKPFHFEELLARLEAVVRRNLQVEPAVLRADNLTLDLHTHVVTRSETSIELTNKEFPLLEYLMRNPGTVLTRQAIAAHAWNENFDRNTNLVDVYVMYLRKKIDDTFEPKLIHTVRGVGYIFGTPNPE